MSKNPFLGLGFKSTFASFSISIPTASPSSINCVDLPAGWYLDLTSEQIFDISAQETSPRGIYVSPEGNHMYIVGDIGDGVDQYSLSIPYNITSASASFVRFKSLSAANLIMQDIFFKSDGTVMFTLDDWNDRVNVYNLGTPWNVSTAVYSTNRSLGSNNNMLNPSGMTFSADGLYMYIFSGYLRYMHRFALATAWNISSATQTTSSFPTSQITSLSPASGIAISSDGSRMIIADPNNDQIYEYTLNTPYSITSTSYIGSLSIASDNTYPNGCNWSSDGKYLYVVGSTPDSVHRYETCSDGAYKILGRP